MADSEPPAGFDFTDPDIYPDGLPVQGFAGLHVDGPDLEDRGAAR